jgi:flavodoxin
MNSLVVYYSKFGNTRQVAEAIAETLESEGRVRVIPADRVTAGDLDGAHLVVMGTPTHRMNLPEEVRSTLDILPKGALRDAFVAAFDTSYKMSALLARFSAAPKLARKLRKLGGRRVAPAETFHVIGREGPLYDGEIERAREWAGILLAKHRLPVEHQPRRR